MTYLLVSTLVEIPGLRVVSAVFCVLLFSWFQVAEAFLIPSPPTALATSPSSSTTTSPYNPLFLANPSGGSSSSNFTNTATMTATSEAMAEEPPSAAFENFLKAVEKLQHENGGDKSVKLLNTTDSSSTLTESVESVETTMTKHINSLVFEIFLDGQRNGQYVLAILDSNDRVDLTALQENVKPFLTPNGSVPLSSKTTEDGKEETPSSLSIALAPSELVQDYCGFVPSTVPPIGLTPPPMLTIVEESLSKTNAENDSQVEQDEDKHLLIGGGGMAAQHLQLSVATILKQANNNKSDSKSIVAPFKQAQGMKSVTRRLQGDDSNGVTNSGDPKQQQILVQQSLLTAPKPFFDIAPPDPEHARQIVENENAEIPFDPTWVTLVGRISGVRRMARTLVFCDLAPLVGPLPTPQAHPWRSPISGKDMAVQLICGKTYCQRMGWNTSGGAEGLRKLKVGQMVLIQGKTNVGNRESLKHWITKDSLDVVLWDYQLLHPNAHNAFSEPMSPLVLQNQKVPKEPKKQQAPPLAHLPVLHLEDLYGDATKSVQVVDSLESIESFTRAVLGFEETLKNENEGAEDDDDEERLSQRLVGVDCEWKPNFLLASNDEPQPVLLLQISLHPLKQVYLFDLQSLLRPLQAPTETMNELESAFASSMEHVLGSKSLVKVGFHLDQDLRRMASSYPHIANLQLVHSVLEASTLASKSMHIHKERNARVVTGSLSRLTAHFLKHSLDKEEQISDWSIRPLTTSQIEYAALDAAVTPVIVSQILEEASMKFFDKPKSWRFLFYDDTTERKILKRLGAKNGVGRRLFVVDQRWYTGDEEPRLPVIPKDNTSAFVDGAGQLRVPSTSVRLNATAIDHLLETSLGTRVARTKDQCVGLYLENSAELPRESKVDFNVRSGYIEFSNAVFLFVNMPRAAGRKVKNYNNEWLEDGRKLTWYFKERDWQNGTSNLGKKMLGTSESNGEDSSSESCVLLFVRLGTKKFISCGRCHVETLPKNNDLSESTSSSEWWELTKLHLVLHDWALLQQSKDFNSLVHPPTAEEAAVSHEESDSED